MRPRAPLDSLISVLRESGYHAIMPTRLIIATLLLLPILPTAYSQDFDFLVSCVITFIE